MDDSNQIVVTRVSSWAITSVIFSAIRPKIDSMSMLPSTVETVGMLAATATTVCWVPQAVRILRTRDTSAISLWMQAAMTAGIFLWLVYGLLIADWPLISSNLVTFVLVASILWLKLRYG